MFYNRIIQTLCLCVIFTSYGCARCPMPAVRTPAIDDSELPATHEASVDLLFSTMKMDDIYERVIPTALDDQIELNPQLVPLRGIMEAFLRKYMGWDALEPELKKMYMASFSKEEIDAMVIFYSTPAGKKAAELTPQLMEQGADLGKRMVNDHLPELTAMIAKEYKQYEQVPSDAEEQPAEPE